MKRLFTALFLVITAIARAGDHTATLPEMNDPTHASLTSVIAGMSNGDTLTLIGGTYKWTSALLINKAITVQGEGMDVTTITPSGGNGGIAAFNISVSGTLGSVGSVTPIPRLTDLTIQGDVSIPATFSGPAGALFQANGTTNRFQVHNVKIHSVNGNNPYIVDGPCGVFDHCIFDLGHSSGTGQPSSWIRHPNWNGSTDAWGDVSWNDGPHWGEQGKAVYFEDCVFLGGTGGAGHDADHGARYVVRHSRLMWHISGHGTESTKRPRGTRLVEDYNNIFDRGNATAFDKPVQVRSGARRDFNNLILNGWNANPAVYGNPAGILERMTNNGSVQPWGIADGANTWDCNVGTNCSTGSGTSTVYESGLVNGVSTSGVPMQVTIRVSGTSVKAQDLYRGYSLRRTGGTGTGNRSSIIENNNASSGGSPNTMLVKYSQDIAPAPQNMNFGASDTYDIRRINMILDQPGRGRGDLLTSGSNTSQPTNTDATRTGNPFQDSEGIYSWNWRRGNMVSGTLSNGLSSGIGSASYSTDLHGGDIDTSYPKINSPTPGEQRMGPDSSMYPITAGTITASFPNITITSDIVYGARYPHGDAGGPAPSPGPSPTPTPTPTPIITGGASSTFTVGTAGSFQFSYSNFSGAPTFTTASTLPSGVSLSTAGLLSGTPGPGTAATYPLTITATYAPASETANKSFSLLVNASNTPPTVSWVTPTAGQVFTAPATIALLADPIDPDGSITKVEFWNGTLTLLATILSPDPYSYTWTGVPAGSYTLRTISYDNGSPAAASTPATRAITVNAPVTPTPPAQIILQP